MHAILFVLGIATSAVGFVVIGFGIPDSAFSLGNTLILAGTVAAVGGFILIALSSVVRQLTRIAQGQSMHAPSMPLEPADSYQPRVQSRLDASQGLAAPPMRPEPMPRPPAPAPVEPKLAPVPAAPASDSDLAWLRPKNATPSFGEQAVIDEMEASLSPAAAPPQPGSQPRLVAPGSQGASAGQAGEVAADVSGQMRGDPGRAPPPVEHPNAGGLFDTVWPEIRPAGRSAETVARARKQEGAPQQRDESKAPAPQAPATQAPMAQALATEEPRPVAILKSGMIDGMAYTLYADGSIEAVLASGPIRFASIDALRMHLEKNA
jgi:hypothetical protein